jgi:hypothetical protein
MLESSQGPQPVVSHTQWKPKMLPTHISKCSLEPLVQYITEAKRSYLSEATEPMSQKRLELIPLYQSPLIMLTRARDI